jgi:hypothetical protein
VNTQAGQQQAIMCFKKFSLRIGQQYYVSTVLAVSWLAEKAVLLDPSCHRNLE